MDSLKLLHFILVLLYKFLHIRNVTFQLHNPLVRVCLTLAMDIQGFCELFTTSQEYSFLGDFSRQTLLCGFECFSKFVVG